MKILIVGCGSIGRRHAANASTLAETAVTDKVPEKSLEIAKDLKIRRFQSIEDGLTWKPDAVVIATPTYDHVSTAMAAIGSGAHVLIEKPISHNLDNVNQLINLADKYKRQVYVVCNMRFHPAIQTVRKNLMEIGKPLFARAHYGNYLPNMRPGTNYQSLYCANRSMGGGVILDAIHEVDYLIWFFGAVKRVISNAGHLSKLDIDVEDYAAMILCHENGVRSEVHLDYLQRVKRRGLEIIGEKGTIVWQSEGKLPELCRVKLFSSDNERGKTLLESSDLDASVMYATLMENFIACINGKSKPILEGRMAIEELAVVLASKQAAEDGMSIEPNINDNR